MVVYGGAGPLHASAIAREIGIRRVLIPYAPGYFSAYGMLFSDLRYDYVRSCFRRLATADFAEIEGLYAAMEDEGRAAIEGSAVQPGADRDRACRRHALRRPGARRHGRTAAGAVRARATAKRSSVSSTSSTRFAMAPPRPTSRRNSCRCAPLFRASCRSRRGTPSPAGGAEPDAGALVRASSRSIPRRLVDTPVYPRDQLRPGNRISGPALDRGARLHHRPAARRRAWRWTRLGNLLIAIGSEAR